MKVPAPNYVRKVLAPRRPRASSSHTGDFGWQQTSRPPERFPLTVSQDEVSAEHVVPFQLRQTVAGGPKFHTMVYALEGRPLGSKAGVRARALVGRTNMIATTPQYRSAAGHMLSQRIGGCAKDCRASRLGLVPCILPIRGRLTDEGWPREEVDRGWLVSFILALRQGRR